ncbi:recombinase family protein [Lacrimispora amygdalina]|uniref:recombinase family protein n=1 Tax=Lacrimispora amygdalina TaxID=253257 RepID=UPI001FA87A46|nr:recombinase family protein [Clostridium indicum]
MIKNPKKPIGAAYVRVSTNDQTELSPAAQLREIKNAASADGVPIPDEYIFIEEKGISGRRADNRKEFQRMISIAKTNPSPFQYLYLWKFSRFARNQEESMFYKSVLRKKCGITIKSVSEPIMEGMFGRLIESIIEWFDEYYSINLSGEVTRGMTEKALRNGYQAAPCLGYRAVGEGKPFIIEEKEYEAVVFIHQSFFNGMDLASIAKEANNHGYCTKRGNSFDRRAVERILKNKFYDGTVTWNNISFQGSHEIRKEVTSVFKANQQRLKQEYRPRNRREVSACRHWASGLLICGYCGASLGYHAGSKTGHQSGYFQCWRYTKGLHKESCCISDKKAESLIIKSLQHVTAAAGTSEYTKRAVLDQYLEKQQLESALEKLRAREIKIKAAYENGIDDLEEYRAGKERLKKTETELKIRIKSIESSKNAMDSHNRDASLCRISSACDILTDQSVSSEAKGRALRSVVKKIIYDKKSGEMKFIYYIHLP